MVSRSLGMFNSRLDVCLKNKVYFKLEFDEKTPIGCVRTEQPLPTSHVGSIPVSQNCIMTFSFLWLLSGQMPSQRKKGKTCSFSFTLARNLVSRKISALPFIKLSVGPVDVLGLVIFHVVFSQSRGLATSTCSFDCHPASVLCVAPWVGQPSGGLFRKQCVFLF